VKAFIFCLKMFKPMYNYDPEKSKSPLLKKSFLLAIEIVKLSRYLIEEHKEFVLSRQILKSGTNPGAMTRAAAHAQSGKDFINKLEIAQKELNETAYWLQLLLATNLISKDQYHPIYNLNHEVKRMTRSSILTKKKNLGLL
jgi:four helix bundle protein